MADRSEIDEVRRRTDIVSIVEPYVTLRRSGRGMTGLCPFHQEKTPSFHVNPELGLWRCFGQCGEGGDVFKFLQKIENLSFGEALERLALQAGVTLTRQSRGGEARTAGESGERDRLYRVNALALRFYRESLSRSAETRAYLQARGLDRGVIENFALGYAPDAWEALTGFLQRQGVSMADAEKAGLVSAGDRGGYFDKMRGRLVFPIFDVQERPVAFGGRLLGEAGPGKPKYWNSPETPVFIKSRTLYGLWRGRKAIADAGRAVVVEGYTDVLAAHQAGFENVVATLGTSLTEDHVRILARLAPVVLLAFDADSAGLKAAFRAAEIFAAQEVEARVIDLPEGEDPDSLLRAGRRADFERAMEDAPPMTEYRLRRLIRRVPPGSDAERLGLFKKALPILAAVPSVIEREQYVKLLAPYHPQFPRGAVYAEEQIRQDAASYHIQGMPGAALPPAPPPRALTAAERSERHLLLALVGDAPDLADWVAGAIRPDEFSTEIGQRLAARLFSLRASAPTMTAGERVAALREDEEDLAALLSEWLMEPEGEPLTARLLEGEVAHLKNQASRRQVQALRRKIDTGQATSDEIAEHQRLHQALRGSARA